MHGRQAGTLPPFLASIPSPDDRRAVSVCPPSHPTPWTKTEWHICSLAVLLLASSQIGIAAIADAVPALGTSLRSQKGFTIREGERAEQRQKQRWPQRPPPTCRSFSAPIPSMALPGIRMRLRCSCHFKSPRKHCLSSLSSHPQTVIWGPVHLLGHTSTQSLCVPPCLLKRSP